MSNHAISLFPKEKKSPFKKSGILPSQRLKDFIKKGFVFASEEIQEDQIQPASLDLRLGPTAYLVEASFLPGKDSTVTKSLKSLLIEEIDLAAPTVLEKGCVYIVPLLEELQLPQSISGKANPKSTTGRLDIFARLITDYGTAFETVKPGYKGKLYLEIVPRSFSIIVHKGSKLSQLRLIRGSPISSTDNKLDDLHTQETLIFLDDAPGEPVISKGLWLSIDTQRERSSNNIIGYKAKKNTPPIDLDKVDYYEPLDFWEPIERSASKKLVLKPGDFYILASKEKVRVPLNFAAVMEAYDPSVGEFRVHYAGFFDPGFGYGDGNINGTCAVLEVRSHHEVPFFLEDGQIVGRLIYERLLAKPEKVYGIGIGSSYQYQEVSLSKQFKKLSKL